MKIEFLLLLFSLLCLNVQALEMNRVTRIADKTELHYNRELFVKADTVVVVPMKIPMGSVNKLIDILKVKKQTVLTVPKMLEATRDTQFCTIPNEVKDISWFMFFEDESKEGQSTVLEGFGQWVKQYGDVAAKDVGKCDFYIFKRAHHIKISGAS